MTYFHYYATTTRNLDRVMQYGVFPLSKALGLVLFKNCEPAKRIEYASNFARIGSAAIYSTLTTAFLGDESRMIDENSRRAVAAELGVDPAKLTFSDYKYSGNTIVSGAHHDIMMLQKYRYGSDALFMLPIAIKYGSKAMGIPWIEHSRAVNDLISKEDGRKISGTQLMISGHNAWDFSVLAGKAAYWAGETYLVQKSSHYEIMKLRENLQSTGKDMNFNDLLGVYQRARNDRTLPMIETKNEYDALRPLLQKMADAYNQHDGKFGIPEIVYLLGLGKINIHGPDNKTVSAEAIANSNNEIDKVLSLGLEGIRMEKAKQRAMQGIPDSAVLHEKTFVDRLGDTATSAIQSVMKGLRGGKKPRHEEYITVRDPGEAVNWNRGVHR
jgi:hypothetical protein